MNRTKNIDDKKLFMVLRDGDVFPNVSGVSETAGVEWKVRITGKVILFREDNRMALIGNKVNNFLLLPGGGIEEGESLSEGIQRECREETGCHIELQKSLGVVEDFRLRDCRHSLSFGFSAKVVSFGVLELTEKESDIGSYVKWVDFSDALGLFIEQKEKVRNGEVKFYNTCFNMVRDHFFIERFKKFARELKN